MQYTEVIAHYGTEHKAAEALNITRQAVNYWSASGGRVPELQAIKLHRLTRGRLRYDPSAYEANAKPANRPSNAA